MTCIKNLMGAEQERRWLIDRSCPYWHAESPTRMKLFSVVNFKEKATTPLML